MFFVQNVSITEFLNKLIDEDSTAPVGKLFSQYMHIVKYTLTGALSMWVIIL